MSICSAGFRRPPSHPSHCTVALHLLSPTRRKRSPGNHSLCVCETGRSALVSDQR